MIWKTIKKNGKTTRINISGKGQGRPKPRQLSMKELRDLERAGIKHPGSLKVLGYHINQDPEDQKKSLNKAINKYGKVETLRKLQALQGQHQFLFRHGPHLSNLFTQIIRI